MITVIYKCDKCGAEQSTREQFWEVGVTARGLDSPSTSNTSYTSGKMMQVCRPCLESLGILVRTREGQPTPPAPPTLEDLIREIVAQGMKS